MYLSVSSQDVLERLQHTLKQAKTSRTEHQQQVVERCDETAPCLREPQLHTDRSRRSQAVYIQSVGQSQAPISPVVTPGPSRNVDGAGPSGSGPESRTPSPDTPPLRGYPAAAAPTPSSADTATPPTALLSWTPRGGPSGSPALSRGASLTAESLELREAALLVSCRSPFESNPSPGLPSTALALPVKQSALCPSLRRGGH